MDQRYKIGPGTGLILFDEIVSELNNGTEVISKKFDASITDENKQQIMAALLYEFDAFLNRGRKKEVYKMVSHFTLDLEGNEITVVANPYYLSRFNNK